jgi:hypothetical protein
MNMREYERWYTLRDLYVQLCIYKQITSKGTAFIPLFYIAQQQ